MVILHSGISHKTLRFWQDPEVGQISSENLVYPLFLSMNDSEKKNIRSLPGQHMLGVKRIEEHLKPLVEDGLKSVLLFGSIDNIYKDSRGTLASTDSNPVIKGIKLIKQLFDDLLIICDVCLCDYTSSGACCIFTGDGQQHIDNQATIDRLAEIALTYADAGCHVVAPSDMMDGRVEAILSKFKASGIYNRPAIMSYSAKFASCMYEPFRSACNITQTSIDRSAHQLPVKARHLAKRAVLRDIEEGADFVIIKPSMSYLDIVRDIRSLNTGIPIATYQTSGEYCMLLHAAKNGSINLEKAVMESLNCITRAGASIIITYYTPMVLSLLKKNTLFNQPDTQ